MNAKLLKCFFAATLVLGLCVPSIGTYAFGDLDDGSAFTEVNDIMQPEGDASGVDGSEDAANVPEVPEGSESNLPQGTNPDGSEDGGTAGSEADESNQADNVDGADPSAEGITVMGATALDKAQQAEPEQAEEGIAPLADEDIMPLAAAGAFTVTGGTAGVDYSYASGVLTILTSTSLTIKNTNPSTQTTDRIEIASGKHADITLDGVFIVTGTGAPLGLAGTSGTRAHVTLADGSVNKLVATAAYAAVQCEGSCEIVIDDSVRNSTAANGNVDDRSTEVVPVDGRIKDQVTLGNGTVLPAGSSIDGLSSANPGKLYARGGPYAAGIGGRNSVIGGYLIFNGGIIRAGAYGGVSTAASIDGLDNAFIDGAKEVSTGNDSAGAGIGGGDSKGATQMVFNNAEVYAYGSYHGAAIGSGWHNATAGDIFINGGYICAQGYGHGNAFGRGCGGNNNKHIIKVSGGTLLPYVAGSNSHLGGSGGNVIITGGSVHATKFEPSAYNTDTDKYIPSPSASDQVFMLTIDLKDSDGLGDADNGGPVKIDNFSLSITGSEKTYGSPSVLDDGKLYIWLPKSVTQGDKEVRVDLTVQKLNPETGKYESTPVDTLFIQKPTESGGNMKRFLFFEFPGEFQSALKKNYDGLPFEPWVLSEDNYIEYTNPTDGAIHKLNKSGYSDILKKELVQFSYQKLDENGKPAGALSQEGAAALPADEGSFEITMTSYQYAEDAKFANSYYGHRSTGKAVITPVPSRIVSLQAAWGKTDGNKSDAFDKLIVVGDVTSGAGTATTCKAPTGKIEIVVDGEVVDTVAVTYPSAGVEGNTTVVTDKAAADALISQAIADNKLNNASLFSLAAASADPAGISALAATPRGTADRDSSYDGREHGIFTYTIDVSKNDYLMPATPTGDKHTVTLNYKPDKNYNISRGLEDNNLQEEIEVEQVKPDSGVTPGPGSDVKEDPTDPDDPDNPDNPDDPDNPSSKEFKKSYTVTGTYGTNNGKIEMTIESPSYGPFEITNSNGAVIGVAQPELVKDASGNPVKKGDNLQYKVTFDMASAGKTDIVMTQKASGAYGKSTFKFDVTVYPNPGDAPKVDVTVAQENLGNPSDPDTPVAPEGMAQPGDTIRYTVTASNTVAGTAWQTPEITDVASKDVTIDPDSIEVAINYPTPPDTPEVDEEGNPIPVPEPVWVKPDPSTYEIKDGKVVFKPSDSVYGGQSVSIRYNATVNPGTSDRNKDTKDPVKIENEATGKGTYGVNENPATQGTNPGTSKDVPAGNFTVKNPDPMTVVPDDVAPGDLAVAKSVKNLSRTNGDRALVGDILEYTINVTNKTPDSCLYDAYVLDPLPKGVTYVPGSLSLVNTEGQTSAPGDGAYNKALNAIGLFVGDLYYGEKAVVTFKAKVGGDAREGGAGNVAFSSGDQPTKAKDPDKDKDDPSDNPDDPNNPDDPDNKPGTNPGNKPHYPNNPVDPDNPDKKPQLPTDPDKININVGTNPTPTPAPDPTKPSVNVDIDGDGKPDVNIDTDGDGEPDVNIVDKDGDGEPDFIDLTDPTIDPTDPETWPKPDVNILPKDPSDPTFDPEKDLIPEVNVDTDGDGKPDVNIDEDGDGKPDKNIDEDKNGTPDDEEDPTDKPGSDFWEEKKIDDPEELDKFIEDLPIPGTNEEPASPGVVLPADPNMQNITISKTAENLDHTDGFTYVGDKVRYTITVANSQKDSAWMAVVVRDDVPVGIEPITDSFKVILADGSEVAVPANAYDVATRILAVNMGDVEGGTKVQFVFDAEIGEEALDSDVGNIAKAYGSLPSGIPGDELNNRAPAGSRFTPTQGWAAYEATHAGISNPDKVYPSAKVSAANKVKPSLDKQLARTGDGFAPVFAGLGAAVVAALALMVLAWRKRQRV